MVIGSEILSEKQMILIGILVVIFVVFAVLVNLLDNKSPGCFGRCRLPA